MRAKIWYRYILNSYAFPFHSTDKTSSAVPKEKLATQDVATTVSSAVPCFDSLTCPILFCRCGRKIYIYIFIYIYIYIYLNIYLFIPDFFHL